jgi:hypothetical protein
VAALQNNNHYGNNHCAAFETGIGGNGAPQACPLRGGLVAYFAAMNFVRRFEAIRSVTRGAFGRAVIGLAAFLMVGAVAVGTTPAFAQACVPSTSVDLTGQTAGGSGVTFSVATNCAAIRTGLY